MGCLTGEGNHIKVHSKRWCLIRSVQRCVRSGASWLGQRCCLPGREPFQSRGSVKQESDNHSVMIQYQWQWVIPGQLFMVRFEVTERTRFLALDALCSSLSLRITCELFVRHQFQTPLLRMPYLAFNQDRYCSNEKDLITSIHPLSLKRCSLVQISWQRSKT